MLSGKTSVLILWASITIIAGCNGTNIMHSKTSHHSGTIKVVVIGDSTVATNPLESPQRGWGQCLQQHFDPSVIVENHARNGRSSKSFIDEGLWAKSLEQKPDYVFIQFGHNDQPGKGPERETDPNTTYKEFLRRYIDESEAVGAKVVLLTSMERRKFDKNGHIIQSLKPWADAAKQVAEEKGVFLIDLHDYSVGIFEKLGDNSSQYLNRDENDRTHWSQAGAQLWAEYIVAQLPKAGPQYKPLIGRLKVKK